MQESIRVKLTAIVKLMGHVVKSTWQYEDELVHLTIDIPEQNILLSVKNGKKTCVFAQTYFGETKVYRPGAWQEYINVIY